MTDGQVAAVVGTLVVLVLALGLLVWQLRSEVRRLKAEVTSLRLVHGSQPPGEDGPDRRPIPPAPTLSSSDSTREPVPLITALAEDRPTNDDDLSAARIASVTLGPPLIKIAAFSSGVRRALSDEQRMRVSYAVRKELRRQHKLRRRRRRSAMAPEGGRP